MKSCILIYEPGVSGHHFEFLAYLIRYANEIGLSESLAVVTREEFKARYLKYFPASGLDPEKFRLLKFLEPDELAWLEDPSLSVLKRHWRGYVLMHRIASEVGASHIHADSFNSLQLFTIRRRDDLPTISCIFYGPFTRMQACGGLRSRFLQKVSVIRRKYLFRISMRSGRYKNVFLLNDEWSAEKLNSDFNVNCCKHLPDPVWDSAFFNKNARSPASGTDTGRKQVLFFGTIREDKGAFLLLRALRRLPAAFQRRLTVVYAGVVSSERERFISEFEQTRQNASSLSIKFHEGYIGYDEGSELYRSSDLVVIPYLRSDRSSGVLNNSVLFGKEVLASGHGLIGSLVTEYQLGYVVDPLNEQSLANSLMKWLEQPKSLAVAEQRARFVSEHTPRAYAETILKNL